MYREIIEKLAAWKNKEDRKPILLTGTHGVGKTTTAIEFAKKHFKKFVVFNVQGKEESLFFGGKLFRQGFNEIMEKYADPQENKEHIFLIFDNLDEEKIGINSAGDIVKFLLQDLMEYNICIISSLDEHVFLEESLLEKMDIYSMYPISLKEFMIINGDEKLLTAVLGQAGEPLSEGQKDKLRRYVDVYFVTGGMPAVLQVYMDTRDLQKVNEARKNSMAAYYEIISRIKDEKLKKQVLEVFEAVGSQLDKARKEFRFNSLCFMGSEKKYKRAVKWLTDHRLIVKIQDLESIRPAKEQKRKCGVRLYFADVGMLSQSYGVQFAQLVTDKSAYEARHHALAEQFVLQQLMVSEIKGGLYFWIGETSQEIEFVCVDKNEIVPVFLNCFQGKRQADASFEAKYHPQLSVEVTKDSIAWENKKIDIPIYAVWNL